MTPQVNKNDTFTANQDASTLCVILPKQNPQKLTCNTEILFVILYPSEYRLNVYFIEKTTEFDKWLKELNDLRAKAKILFRLQKLENEEYFGDCNPVGDGISELKINYAKGYRVYFKETNGKIIILLIGGDKSTQQKDIEKAKEIWKKLKK